MLFKSEKFDRIAEGLRSQKKKFITLLSIETASVYDKTLVSIRGVAQLGSAPLWGSGGRGFESRRSD